MVRTARGNKYRSDRTLAGRLGVESLERREMLSGSPNVVKVEVASTSWTTAFVAKLNPSMQNATGVVEDTGNGFTIQAAHGYAIPVGSTAQSATLTWDNINQIAITFSEEVVIQSADLSVTGVNTAQYHFSGFHYDPISRVAIWTFASPLNKDRVRLDLDGNGANGVKDLDGNLLDGEWTNNSSVTSGNGTSGGDFEFNFNVLPTDINNSASVTSYDYVYIRQLDGKTLTSVGYISNRDIDGNGTIDSVDWQKALDRALQVLPTGTAAGTSNDAPTTSGFAPINISNASIDAAISLLTGFNDSESGSSGLTYSIVANSNPELFDEASIHASAQSLVLNAAAFATGRASITIRATDAGGLSVDTTIIVDVNRENLQPHIEYLSIETMGYGMWSVSGFVVDDEDVSNFTVYFTEVFSLHSAVDEHGHFSFVIDIPESASGIEKVMTKDSHGLWSAEFFGPMQLS